jgi:hypothetical protein
MMLESYNMEQIMNFEKISRRDENE